MDWIFANEESVLRVRNLDLSDVFGADLEQGAPNLYKYFVKSFGCRLVEASQAVPAYLIELLSQEYFKTALRLNFAVNEDILLLPERSQFIGKGDLHIWQSPEDQAQSPGYTWNEHVSWFTTNYWYDRPVDGRLGSTWTSDTQYVYLGSSTPLSPEDRAHFIELVAASKQTRAVAKRAGLNYETQE